MKIIAKSKIFDMSDTMHSAEKELVEHITIKKEIVNKYKTQIITTFNTLVEVQTAIK